MYNSVAFTPFTMLCTHSLYFQNIFIPQGKSLHHSALFQASSPHPPSGNHQFTFCLYGLPHSPFFLKTESETIWPLLSGAFHLACCFRGSSMLVQVSVLPSFLGLNTLFLFVNTRFCLSTMCWCTFELFPPFAIVNSVALNICVQVSECFLYFVLITLKENLPIKLFFLSMHICLLP